MDLDHWFRRRRGAGRPPLPGRYVAQPFAGFIQGFLEFDDRFLHPFVGFRRPADQEKVLGLGDATMAVRIEADAEKADDLRGRGRGPAFATHGRILPIMVPPAGLRIAQLIRGNLPSVGPPAYFGVRKAS